MKNTKFIIVILIATIFLLIGFIIGKRFQDSESKAEVEYQKNYQQTSEQESLDDAIRTRNAIKNLKNTR